MWATSVAKVLSGEVTCEWAYWFKAHFKHDKRESGDWTMTQAAHMEMVRRWADDLVERGYSVRLEGQNAFHATGTKATVGVRPDLVAVRGTELRILDCKTGASRGWHRFQVLLYMLLTPRSRQDYRGLEAWGEVVYEDGSLLTVAPEEVDTLFKERLGEVMRRLTSGDELPKMPSLGECRYCDITKADCPERQDEPEAAADAKDLF